MMDVLAICGAYHLPHLTQCLVPSLARSVGIDRIRFHILNYASAQPLLSQPLEYGKVTVIDWSAHRKGGRLGFGEAVNTLYGLVRPAGSFVCVNPDTYVDSHMLLHMQRGLEDGVGILEARQWPSEHPKEYDVASGDTPWASGACFAMQSRCFEQLGGFDPIYFMYCEDVDISWRAWMAGWRVKYQPDALCHHYTGLLSYRTDRFYFENFYTARNYLILNYKFFGDEGEQFALELLRGQDYPDGLLQLVQESYRSVKTVVRRFPEPVEHEKIKVLGFNRFHELRADHA